MKVIREAKVMINGLKWHITEVDECPVGKGVVGSTYYDTCHIYLKEDTQPLLNFEQTLIHELTHAFQWSYGLFNITHTAETTSDFMGTYARKILEVADNYMKHRK